MTLQEQIGLLNEQVQVLINKYEQLRTDYANLLSANEHIQKELRETSAQLVNLQKEHRTLQVAHGMTGTEEERAVARREINRIIAQVDKAIEILMTSNEVSSISD